MPLTNDLSAKLNYNESEPREALFQLAKPQPLVFYVIHLLTMRPQTITQAPYSRWVVNASDTAWRCHGKKKMAKQERFAPA